MISVPCALAWAVVLIAFPVIALLWATESKSQRIRRWRSRGQAWAAVTATCFGNIYTLLIVRTWKTSSVYSYKFPLHVTQ